MIEVEANAIIAKMNQYKCTDFEEDELDRVFEGCCSPVACKRGVRLLLASDNIKIENGKVIRK